MERSSPSISFSPLSCDSTPSGSETEGVYSGGYAEYRSPRYYIRALRAGEIEEAKLDFLRVFHRMVIRRLSGVPLTARYYIRAIWAWD